MTVSISRDGYGQFLTVCAYTSQKGHNFCPQNLFFFNPNFRLLERT